MNNQTLTKSIMRRVYALWLLRKATRPFAVKCYILAALTWQLVRTVSVPDVLANAQGFAMTKNVSFLTYAFVHTEIVVQILVVGAVGVFALMFRDLFFKKGKESYQLVHS